MENGTVPQDEKLTPDEAAQVIINGLANDNYSLADKVAVSRSLRKLLRGEAEEAQKQLSSLIDSL
ncbi:hypothetical protein [Spirosoma rigui]|uniref:hypothetical protein n=1 Tax=Spirosoma rigui TaxID=564064 RepID=UPI0009B0F3F6|nr:hypothetical protein [Spirosoma rigui]